MDKRKSTFLAQYQWKTKPFCFYPPSDMQLLISDAATLPSLLEAVDNLGNLPSDIAISEAQKVRSGLLEVRQSLCKWKCVYEMDTACPWFPNITTANVHTHSLSFEIICLIEVEKVDLFLSDHGRIFELAAGQTSGIDCSERHAWRLADKICQSVEYFLQEDMRLFGPASAIFPLRIAYDVLSGDIQRNQDNIGRCQELISRIGQTGISTIPHFPAKLAELG